jgi:hypothetical protein
MIYFTLANLEHKDLVSSLPSSVLTCQTYRMPKQYKAACDALIGQSPLAATAQ